MNTTSQVLPALRADLRFTAHGDSRGVWYAVEDLRNCRFVRLGRKEYLVAAALDGKRTLDEIVAAVNTTDSSIGATTSQACTIVAWLASQGLIDVPAQSTEAAPTSGRSQVSPAAQLDPFFIRASLVSGPTLERMSRPLGGLLSFSGAIPAVAVVLIAAALVSLRFSEFLMLSTNLFVEDAKIWWLMAWLVLKIVHELGHAVAACRVGCPLRSAGIHLIFLAPVPYIDVTDLWSIPDRWQRIVCSAAGMMFEIVVAALAAIVAVTSSNESVKYFAAAVATLGTVTTIGFNANPFMRFDGYYILTDLIGRPNLWTDGQRALGILLKTAIWPFRTHPGKFSWPMAAYGFTCLVYRVVMLVTIAWWALLVWQGVGMLLIAWGTYLWFVSPILRHRKLRRPEANCTPRTWRAGLENLLGLSFSVGCTLVILWLPSPIQPTIPGVVAFSEPAVLRSDAPGFLREVLATENELVKQGQIIARLSNPALAFELNDLRIQLEIAREKARVLQARGELAKSQAEQANLKSLENRLAQSEQRLQSLEIRATRDGQLRMEGLPNRIGQFLAAGALLGSIVNTAELEVRASTNQKDCPTLQRNLNCLVRIHSHGGQVGQAQVVNVNARGDAVLDEPALAACYGGPVPVELHQGEDGMDQLKLLRPRFQIRAQLQSQVDRRWTPGEVVWVSIPNERVAIGELLRRQAVNWWEGLQKEQALSTQ